MEIPYVLCFHYASIDGDGDSVLYVLLKTELTGEQIAALEDSISSYIDSTATWGYEELIHNVLDADGYEHYVLSPQHTFLI